MRPIPKLEAALKIAALGIGGVYPAWLKNDYTGNPDKATSRVYAPHKTRHHATTDAAILRQWWTDKPTDNPKVLIGPSYVVIDIDTSSGGHQDGTTNITQLGELPTTYNETTPSNGKHLIYKLPTGTTFKNTLVPCAGIELLGEGATFIASGSTTQKGKYTDNNAAIVEAPPNIVALIEQLKPKPQTRPTPSTLPTPATLDTDKARTWAERKIDELRAELRAEPSGQRNRKARDIGYQIGKYLHLTTYSYEQILSALEGDIAHWADFSGDVRTIRKAVAKGQSDPFTPTFTDNRPATQETIKALLNTATTMQWGGMAQVGKRRVNKTAAYHIYRHILSVGLARGFMDVAISGRQIQIELRLGRNTVIDGLRYLTNEGLITITPPTMAQHAPLVKIISMPQTETTDKNICVYDSGLELRHCPPHQTAPACGRRVVAKVKRERFIGSLSSTRKYKGDTVINNITRQSIAFDTPAAPPLEDIVPIKNWSAIDALRTYGEPEKIEYAGLGHAMRLIIDVLAGGQYQTGELMTLTGLSRDTLNRVLNRGADAGIVVKGNGRRHEAHTLTSDAAQRIIEFYETGNIAAHQTKIRLRIAGERIAYQRYLDKTTPRRMNATDRIADITQTVAEATLELVPTTTVTKSQTVQAITETEHPTPATTATTTPEPQPVTSVTIASDDERAPTPAPTTINIVSAWLQKFADIAEDVRAGNCCWIPKREIPASEFDAVRNKAMSYNIHLIDANVMYYQAKAAA